MADRTSIEVIAVSLHASPHGGALFELLAPHRVQHLDEEPGADRAVPQESPLRAEQETLQEEVVVAGQERDLVSGAPDDIAGHGESRGVEGRVFESHDLRKVEDF